MYYVAAKKHKPYYGIDDLMGEPQPQFNSIDTLKEKLREVKDTQLVMPDHTIWAYDDNGNLKGIADGKHFLHVGLQAFRPC